MSACGTTGIPLPEKVVVRDVQVLEKTYPDWVLSAVEKPTLDDLENGLDIGRYLVEYEQQFDLLACKHQTLVAMVQSKTTVECR